MQIFLGDDRVYWNGKPENPQPGPKLSRLWIIAVITAFLNIGGLCLAVFLSWPGGS